jgi:hypothetical protein
MNRALAWPHAGLALPHARSLQKSYLHNLGLEAIRSPHRISPTTVTMPHKHKRRADDGDANQYALTLLLCPGELDA